MTLIESLVAISILLVVAAAVMSSAQGGLSATYASGDTITAYYLAQEANEYIRNTRDSNTLTDGAEWDRYLEDCIDSGCQVDTTLEPSAGGLEECSPGEEDGCRLFYNEDTHRYGHQEGAETSESQFKRYVELTRLGDDELRVTTTIEWRMGVRERSISLESLIFNWNQ